MIDVKVKYADNTVSIDFPCSGNHLEAMLAELRVDDMTKADLWIEKVSDFEPFSFMENNFINLDELNYLAAKMNCLDNKELKKYCCVIEEFKIRNMPDLINLTQNLHRYTLIQDMSSAEKVGRELYLTRNIAIPESNCQTINFSEIGKELIISGRGRFTEYGMLFINDDIPAEYAYEGIPTDENYLRDKLTEVEIDNGKKKMFLWLPETKNTIIRMLKYMGEDMNLKGCAAKITNFEEENSEWLNRLQNVLDDECLESLNNLSCMLNTLRRTDEFDKLAAVVEYAEVTDTDDIVKLGRNLDKFQFIEEAILPEDIAVYLIDKAHEYEICLKLREYLDYEKFGEDVMISNNGEFVGGRSSYNEGGIFFKTDY